MMYKIIRRGRRLVHPVSAINLTLANREPDRVCCSTLSNNTYSEQQNKEKSSQQTNEKKKV
jgi:hypothetical protein